MLDATLNTGEMQSGDRLGAFVDYPPVQLAAAPDGPLSGLTFGVKDLFDVAGYPTGCGHPLKRSQSPVASVTASCVAKLLHAGATFVGKTHTDEIGYSLNGENAHYGTPLNPRAPGRIPGGSSSGSASAVAGGLVDFAVGSDTGGSVRLPASYCGIWGMRPTHGIIPLDHAMRFAPSFDTVGWFARDPALLAMVGRLLLPGQEPKRLRRLLRIDDAFGLVGNEVTTALQPAMRAVATILGAAEPTRLAPDGLERWAETFRVHQAYEIWQQHGRWIEENEPEFGPGVRERLRWASSLRPEDYARVQRERAEIIVRLRAVTEDDCILMVPTVPGIAPLRGTLASDLEEFRNRALALLCIAGLGGLPQIHLPLGHLNECPIGLSVIGPRGGDLALLQLVSGLGAQSPSAYPSVMSNTGLMPSWKPLGAGADVAWGADVEHAPGLRPEGGRTPPPRVASGVARALHAKASTAVPNLGAPRR